VGNEVERVEEYLAGQPDGVRENLEAIRKAIRTAAPEAEEVFRYGIPGFVLRGKPFMYYGAWKKFYSVYPVREEMLAELGAGEMEGVKIVKSTMRISMGRKAPVELVGKIARMRAKR
jgi:uncharacterized protein YdhG (YjbR/CyaY superfamily)